MNQDIFILVYIAFLYIYNIHIHIQQETLYARWNGMTAVMLASKNGHTDTVKVLIAARARVSVTENRIEFMNFKYSINSYVNYMQ